MNVGLALADQLNCAGHAHPDGGGELEVLDSSHSLHCVQESQSSADDLETRVLVFLPAPGAGAG